MDRRVLLKWGAACLISTWIPRKGSRADSRASLGLSSHENQLKLNFQVKMAEAEDDRWAEVNEADVLINSNDLIIQDDQFDHPSSSATSYTASVTNSPMPETNAGSITDEGEKWVYYFKLQYFVFLKMLPHSVFDSFQTQLPQFWLIFSSTCVFWRFFAQFLDSSEAEVTQFSTHFKLNWLRFWLSLTVQTKFTNS